MTNKINLKKSNPTIFNKVIELNNEVKLLIKKANIEESFFHLLLLRVSQINGCAYCLRMHTKDALDCGESIERISVIPAWRETQYFNEKERASLSLVEAISNIIQGQVPNEVYEDVKEVLNEDEIAAVEWSAITMNTLNRIAIASRYEVK
ncbi:carboxymuconolactone decarboxylase family protein [Arcobacter sp. F2176]|uniref:carboxymuconolactone decarboxylase family protein n=1 Tax=Arcobacter sp. F2176 TaxID=2044511 RepID=UPI00100ACD53|nr:carboxymuconolactone decarboxylase family protein [Arcobacter sp. F2176]RXJ80526.1 alkylhydroperoxidase [Arcobacter sp. F2176]